MAIGFDTEQVEMVVTREMQQLRVEMHELHVEMHEEFQQFDGRITQRLDGFETEMTRRFDTFQSQITQRRDGHSRWLNTSLIVLFLAMLGNILKDYLR